VAGIAWLGFGLVGWALEWLHATGFNAFRPSEGLVAAAALMMGFAGLGIARTSGTALLPLRINLSFVVGLALLLFAGFPRPPFLGLFALIVTISVASWLLLEPRPTIAFVLLAIQAVLGLYLGWATWRFATVFPISDAVRVPLTEWGALAIGVLAGLWHARTLIGSRPSVAADASS
jgi:hypothetical protein